MFGIQMDSEFKWIRNSNVRYSSPYCTWLFHLFVRRWRWHGIILRWKLSMIADSWNDKVREGLEIIFKKKLNFVQFAQTQLVTFKGKGWLLNLENNYFFITFEIVTRIPNSELCGWLEYLKLFLFFFRCFLLISGVKSLKKVWNEQKRLKTAEKKYFDQL